jgi:hypothetical protein
VWWALIYHSFTQDRTERITTAYLFHACQTRTTIKWIFEITSSVYPRSLADLMHHSVYGLKLTVVECGCYLHPNCMNAGSVRQMVQWPVNEDAVEACLVHVVAWIAVVLIHVPFCNTQM